MAAPIPQEHGSALGVSGGSSAEDEVCAEAGAAVLK